MTDDTILPFSFPAIARKKVTAAFDGGRLTCDGGVMLLALADHCDDAGTCYPSMERLGRKCRVEPRSARRIIRRLEEGGWITVDVGSGRKNCNVYHVQELGPKVPRTESPPDLNADKVGPKRPESRTPRSPEPYNHQEPSGQEKIFSFIEEGLKAGRSWPVRMMPQNITDEMLRRGALTYREARLRHYPHTPELNQEAG